MTAETIARGLDLRRNGLTWRGACPIHGGSSFTLTEKDGKPVFYCWSCGEHGRAAILAELKRRGLWPSSDWTPAQRRDFAAQRQRDEQDLAKARPFADAAHILAEEILEKLPLVDSGRPALTRLIANLRTDTGMVQEYRAWRSAHPEMTRALVRAGRNHQRRIKRLVEDYLGVPLAA